MRGRHGLLAVALAVLLSGGAGCAGGRDDAVRIGVLTDCQGPLRAYEDAELSGALLPFIGRGGALAGATPTAGVEPITVAGRRVELVRGCAEVGEWTVFVEEARRLIETEGADAIVGGASVVTREVARRYPDVLFGTALFDEQETTLRHPAGNLFRVVPDTAQLAAGLGAYAYRELGWRRAAIVAGDQQPGWGGAAGFIAEFCALGGDVVTQEYRSFFTPRPGLGDRALAARPDGVAAFLNAFDAPQQVLRDLLPKLDRPERQLLLWAPTMEDGTVPALGGKLEGVVGTAFLPATTPSRALRDYTARHRKAFPQIPDGLGTQSWVMGYHDTVEALLVALERAGGDASDGGRRWLEELRRLPLELPAGAVRLDRNRQVVRDLSLVRVRGGGLEHVGTVAGVEQTYGGLLSSAPPPGPGTQPCKRATPPPWAR